MIEDHLKHTVESIKKKMIDTIFIMECFDIALNFRCDWKVFQTDKYTLYILLNHKDLSSIIKDTGSSIIIEMRYFNNAKLVIRESSTEALTSTRIFNTIKKLLDRKSSEYDYFLDK